MQSTFDTKTVVSVIEEQITPFIGRSMAKTSTELHCEKLGIGEWKMTQEEADALLDRLSKAMVVFVGREKTDQLIVDIKNSIGIGG